MDGQANNKEERPLTTGEIAQFCHVSHRAVLKWVTSGKLKAYRTPGNHSRVNTQDFVLFLEQYHMPVPEALRPSAGVPRVKILIVDDDRGIAHSLNRVLMLENKYETDVAFDGFTAGRKFAQFKPDFVILDIRMPGVDGYEVCAYIRRFEHKHVKILAISGASEPHEIKKIMDLGADDFLMKPFSNTALMGKIAQLIGKKV